MGVMIIFSKFKSTRNTNEILENMRALLDKSLEEEQSLNEYIQILILNFNKGENGLIVKHLRDNIFQNHLRVIDEFIEKFNERSLNSNIWNNNISVEYSAFLDEKFSNVNSMDLTEWRDYYVLFCLNYVFVAYSNKKYRKALNITLK